MKKGSLQLSITAIVVIVIAFVVLGLGLGLTRTIFDKGEKELIKAFDITELEDQPTSSKPITVSEKINIDRKKQLEEKIGYYNKGSVEAKDALFKMKICIDQDGSDVSADELPTIVNAPQDVGPSDSKGYNVIIKENGLGAGSYVCTLGVAKKGTDEYYETKQVFLQVNA